MSKREFYSHEDRDRYMREIQSVACLAEHPNVVNYFRSWQQDSHFYIQMELCESGNLRTLLDSLKEPLVERQACICLTPEAHCYVYFQLHIFKYTDYLCYKWTSDAFWTFRIDTLL